MIHFLRSFSSFSRCERIVALICALFIWISLVAHRISVFLKSIPFSNLIDSDHRLQSICWITSHSYDTLFHESLQISLFPALFAFMVFLETFHFPSSISSSISASYHLVLLTLMSLRYGLLASPVTCRSAIWIRLTSFF